MSTHPWSGREPGWPRPRSGWPAHHRFGALALSAGLIASLLNAATATPTALYTPAAPVQREIPHTLAASGHAPKKPSYKTYNPAADAALPGTGSAVVALPAAAGAPVRAGSLPVAIGRAANAGSPDKLQVTLASQQTAVAAGVHGVLFSVTPADTNGSGPVDVAVDDAKFLAAYGGDYASRLHLVELPACALTTPSLPQCQTETNLAPVGGSALTARVSMGPVAGTAAAGTGAVTGPAKAAPAHVIVLGATSGSGGSSGTYAATSLTAAGSWSAGGNTGSFDYTYPLQVPPAVGGSSPSISLTYDSSSQDGLTMGTNDQSSWVGDGWDTSTENYIERTYQACSDDTSSGAPANDGDECADGQILTMSLNGESTQIVYDDATDTFHPASDSSTDKITRLTTCKNGTYNNECWEVVENGIQFYFGLDQLPGYAATDTSTDSAWTVPVYCVNTAYPCSSGNTTNFGKSSEVEGYRWNLDYEVDPHGNATAWYYTAEQNYYGADMATTPVVYDRGGYLDRIDYGMTSSTVYSGTAPEQIVFNAAQRCIVGTPPGNNCTDAQFTVADAAYWPDVPIDQNCASTGTCDNHGPSFWTRMMLSSIVTQIQVNGATQKVDEYDLTHTFPDGGDHAPTLWLASVEHTGHDTLGGATTTAPGLTTSFGNPLQLPNRVGTIPNEPVMYHDRIQTIATESGAQITVAYNPTTCTTANVPTDPATNTMPCYPVYWTPYGASAPELDWFQKYTVHSVLTQDLHDANQDGTYPELLTTYKYDGGVAWHYDDNEVVKAKNRTYGQYRGYATVETRTGDPAVFHLTNGVKVYDQTTLNTTTYFRGMSQNTPTGSGGSNVSLTSMDGKYTVNDVNTLAGQVFETDSYTADTANGGTLQTATVTIPQIIGPTASRARTGLPALTAQMVVTANTYTRTAVSYGWRYTETDQFYNTTLKQPTTGMPVQEDDRGEVAAAGNIARCSWTKYVENPSETLVLPAETITAAQDCDTAGAAQTGQLISDNRTSYDGNAFTWDGASPAGTEPTKGDATATQQASGPTGVVTPSTFVTMASTSYDAYGRVLTVTRTPGSTAPGGASLAQTTTTTYTPASGALPTTSTTTTQVTGGSSPTYQTETSTLDPARNVPTESVSITGGKTDFAYDTLGRVTAVWQPNESKAAGALPNDTYSYTISQSGPSLAVTNTLQDSGAYAATETLYDAMMRPMQTQATSENDTTVVCDTQYDSHGWTVLTNNSYNVAGTPSTALVQVSQTTVPDTTVTDHDGQGHADQVSEEHDGVAPTGMTETMIDTGDTQTAVPMDGGTVTSKMIDARGLTTAFKQYTSLTQPTAFTISGTVATGFSATGGTTNTTTYTYNTAGKQSAVTGPDQSRWTYTYDLLGRVTGESGPDTGAGTTTYDDAGDITSTTDARGVTLDYTYDLLGRKLTETDASNSGFTLATWLYDTLQAGQLTSSTAYVPGVSGGYTVASTGYTVLGKSTGTKITLPASESPLPSTYTTTYAYTTYDENLSSQTDQKVAGLLGETVDYGRDAIGNPLKSYSTLATYVGNIDYTDFAEPSRVTFGPTTNPAYQLYSYDDQTRRLTDVLTTRTAAPGPNVDDTSYSYDPDGLPVSILDKQEESGSTVVDQQCFAYDPLGELTTAWTATDGCANQTPVGNPSTLSTGTYAYGQTYGYDAIGDRQTETDLAVNGASGPTSTTYDNGTAPPTGTCTDTTPGTHSLTSTSTTVPGSSTSVNTAFCYDKVGDLVSRTPSTGAGQSLVWNDQGQLAQITQGSQTTSFVYSADGNELIRRDPTTTTLYAGDTEIVVSTTATPHTLLGATRFYTAGGNGDPVAMRSTVPADVGVFYLFDDPHGTSTIAMNASTQVITREEYTPFGETLGASGSWPDSGNGFLGKPVEATTGYTDIGARKYDPTLGRFISVDPTFEAASPQQMGGYTYSGDEPVGSADPSGEWADMVDGGPAPRKPSGNTTSDSSPSKTSAPVVVFLSPHFGFDSDNVNLAKLAAAYNKVWQWDNLKKWNDGNFNVIDSGMDWGPPYGVDTKTAAYGMEVAAWDQVCKTNSGLCSGSFANSVSGLHSSLDSAMQHESNTWGCFFGSCHYAGAVASAAVVYFRGMAKGPDGQPVTGRDSSKLLGARQSDVEGCLNDDGTINISNEGMPPGLSTRTDPEKMRSYQRPAWLEGTDGSPGSNKVELYAIVDDDVQQGDLAGRPDPKDSGHMILGPSEEGVNYDEYDGLVQATQSNWMLVRNEEDYLTLRSMALEGEGEE